MDKKLKEIFNKMGIEGDDFYINDKGEVKQKGILGDTDTGYYQDENGSFKKKGILGDTDTGMYQNEKGEFKEKGILGDTDTGFYQDKHGDFKKKEILGDTKTGYYQDEKGNFKKEDLFGRSYKRERYSQSDSESDGGFSATFWFIIYGVVIAVALLILNIAVYLSPLILLVWYLIKKRSIQWIAIVGMLFTGYLIYDISNFGFISSLTKNFMNFNDISSQKYVLIAYFAILVTTLGFYLDKYTSSKIPVSENGNFFEKKTIKERRPFIAILSILLLVGFSMFKFARFSDNNHYNNSNTDYNPDTSTVNSTNYNNSTSNNTSNFNGKSAIITDPDGFTNVRAGKGTNTNVIYKLKTNEKFIVYPTNNKWWKVKLNNGQNGFIFHNRVYLINNNLKGKYPIASNRVLNHNDLNQLSKSELQIMRNEIFARYGYIFNNGGRMDKYFRSTNWYRPQYNNVQSKLTQIEKKNIKFIQQYEK